MTTTLIEKKTNGNALSQMDGETLSKLVLGGDLSKLDEEQKLVYVYRVTSPADKKIQYHGLSAAQVDQTQIFRFGAATKF